MVTLPSAHVVGRPGERVLAGARQVGRGAVVAAKVGLWLTVVVASLAVIALLVMGTAPTYKSAQLDQLRARQEALNRRSQIGLDARPLTADEHARLERVRQLSQPPAALAAQLVR